MYILKRKCSGKGKNNCKIPKSSMRRCFRNRSRHFGWSGMKEGNVVEDEVRKGKKARSHPPCKSLWELELLFPERWEATEGSQQRRAIIQQVLQRIRPTTQQEWKEGQQIGGYAITQARDKRGLRQVAGVGHGDLDILWVKNWQSPGEREIKNGQRWHLVF